MQNIFCSCPLWPSASITNCWMGWSVVWLHGHWQQCSFIVFKMGCACIMGAMYIFCIHWNTLSHIASLKVIWGHIASFRVSWSQTHCDSTWLKLSQAVSLCLKMLQKLYYGLTWIMCTLPAYEINESCVPIDSLMTVVLFWYLMIFSLTKWYPIHISTPCFTKEWEKDVNLCHCWPIRVGIQFEMHPWCTGVNFIKWG